MKLVKFMIFVLMSWIYFTLTSYFCNLLNYNVFEQSHKVLMIVMSIYVIIIVPMLIICTKKLKLEEIDC